MKEQLKAHKRTLALLGTASFYFLSVDVLADMAMAPAFGGTAFLLLRAAYMLTMSAGFLLYPAFERRFGANWILPAAGIGIALLLGTACLESSLFLAFCILLSLFLGGLFGAAAYARTASRLMGNPYLGRLSTCGMGLGSLLQVLVSVFPLALFPYALVICFSLGLTAYLLRRDDIEVPSGYGSAVVHEMGFPALLPVFLLCVMLISFMGGVNDGELALHQASGELDLQAWPRLLYFAGMMIAGIVYDLYGFGKLSALTLFVMILSEAGAIFMYSPSTIVLDEALYSAFAGIVIIFFTVPLFSCGGLLFPSLGRAIRLPALACGMLFYEFILRQLPPVVTIVAYVFLAAALAMLFIVSGFTAGKGVCPGSDGADSKTVSGETGRIMEEMAAEDSSPVSSGTDAGGRPELFSSNDAAAIERFCKTYDLTQREAEIMQMILKSNLPTTQLSGELHVSERTLYRHLSALYQKTGTDSRVGLLMKYYDESK